jgi:hypothetical protein
MTRKQLPRLLIPRHCGVLHICRGVLNVLVPQPIFHKVHIATGIEQVHSDRVPQHMKMPLPFRELRPLVVALYKIIEPAPAYRQEPNDHAKKTLPTLLLVSRTVVVAV